MLGRWGQENFIKAMKHELHIDHFPGCEYLAYQDRIVENPERRRLRQEKKTLGTRISDLKQQLADLHLKPKPSRKPPAKPRGKAPKKEQPDAPTITAELQGLLRQKRELNRQQRSLDKKVPLSQALDIQKMSRVDFERKGIVDVLKLTVYMAWRDLEQRLASRYKRKDLRQVVKMIAGRGASLWLEREVLHCQLKHFDQPSVQLAAEALCAELNTLDVRTLDKWQFSVRYSVATRPAGPANTLRTGRRPGAQADPGVSHKQDSPPTL